MILIFERIFTQFAFSVLLYLLIELERNWMIVSFYLVSHNFFLFNIFSLLLLLLFDAIKKQTMQFIIVCVLACVYTTNESENGWYCERHVIVYVCMKEKTNSTLRIEKKLHRNEWHRKVCVLLKVSFASAAIWIESIVCIDNTQATD